MRENDPILEMYLFESSMLLNQLDEVLLLSEKEKYLSDENINEIFRIMHTVKGSSAMMEFDALSYVSHKLEDLFYFIRDNGLNADYFASTMDLVLEVSDFLKDEVAKIQSGEKLAEENDKLVDKIVKLLSKMSGEASTTDVAAVQQDPVEKADPIDEKDPVVEKDLIAEKDSFDGKNSFDNHETYNIHVHFTSDSQMENVRAFMLVTKFESMGVVLHTVPEDIHTDPTATPSIEKNGFYCCLATDASPEEIERAARSFSAIDSFKFLDNLPDFESDKFADDKTEEGSDILKEDHGGSKYKSTVAAQDHTESSVRSKNVVQNLIAVDLNKLDALMDLVGEIVITESMVTASPDLEGMELENFDKAARQLGKLTDELQDIAMSIRMIPVSATFQKMNRLVRDMNKRLDSDVDLVLMGETTEVDKTIIDGIVDPLMHLVRNAIDHGIESKEERISKDKDPNGQIILSAQNVGGEIIITVSDDGKGLDAADILEKAKARNLLNKAESEYTEREIFNLLTYPGFSTKENVTEFSGRGVGMDVVKKSIERIGGNITIESVKSAGTTVLIRIPLTLSIIPCMEVRVGREIFSIPISNIHESLRPTADQLLRDPDGNEMIMIRGKSYSIIRLNEIYDIDNGCTEITDGVFMMVNSSDRTACIFADEILGQHRVVVKPLPLYLNKFDVTSMGISGCTILGNGNISLILDVQGILNQY